MKKIKQIRGLKVLQYYINKYFFDGRKGLAAFFYWKTQLLLWIALMLIYLSIWGALR